MKKNIKKYYFIVIILIAGMFSSCDKGFEDINKSVDFVSVPNLDFMLPPIQLNMIDRNYYTISAFQAPYVGHVNTTYEFKDLVVPGDQDMGEHFQWIYRNALKSVADLIDRSKENPDMVNYYNIGRIIKVYLTHQLTDVYGDIPYFEANKGYTDRIFTPAYDPQQKIYEDMFKELEEATLGFNNTKISPVQSDIVYKGDLTKWKKFANSLMLRLGLRIMKVDAINGKKWIDKAIAGGLLASNDDNFVVYYLPNSGKSSTANGTPHIFISSSYIDKFRLASPFIDSLKNRNDPRTTVYAMRMTAPFTKYHDGDHSFDNQRGYPPFGSIAESRNNFSVSNIRTFGRYDAPYVHLSYAQVQLQLAECVVRGIISGDAKTYYENGVRAAMAELSVYGPDAVISVGQQNAYLLENPYVPENALNMINTQYWIETHYNWYETWANMRRSGYPKMYELLDKTIPGNIGAVLPKRLTYPPAEIIANPKLQDAIQRQGPNLTSTPVWWDKQ